MRSAEAADYLLGVGAKVDVKDDESNGPLHGLEDIDVARRLLAALPRFLRRFHPIRPRGYGSIVLVSPLEAPRCVSSFDAHPTSIAALRSRRPASFAKRGNRAGDCYDNAMMESHWATLKKEIVQHAKFRTRAQGRTVHLVISAPNSSRRLGELVSMIVCPLKF